jgi:hypothetical protein
MTEVPLPQRREHRAEDADNEVGAVVLDPFEVG